MEFVAARARRHAAGQEETHAHPDDVQPDPRDRLADRSERHIVPPLKAGAIVLADRYAYTAFARDVARGVNARWVRNLYRFAVTPTIGFYFRISVDEAVKRIIGGRNAISYYEAGTDCTHIDDTEESFRVFQGSVIDEYDRMVDEFGLVVIDASQSIEQQQVQMRAAVTTALVGARKLESHA
jgi:dTMP kinase